MVEKRKRDSTQGMEDVRVALPDDATLLGRYRRLAGGAHWGFSVVDGDPLTRLALNHAQPDDIHTIQLIAGTLVVALGDEPFDGLWVRHNTGAGPGRLWLFRNRMAMLQGLSMSIHRDARNAGAPLVKTAIGTSSVTIVPANANRQGVYLRNKSTTAQVIDVAFNDHPAEAGKGVNFLPEEEKSWDVEDGLGPGTSKITGISSAVGGVMQYQEF